MSDARKYDTSVVVELDSPIFFIVKQSMSFTYMWHNYDNSGRNDNINGPEIDIYMHRKN